MIVPFLIAAAVNLIMLLISPLLWLVCFVGGCGLFALYFWWSHTWPHDRE
jgi:hypothetical protein